jgi:two-component system, chemotaxis family, sensor kinase Cph1
MTDTALDLDACAREPIHIPEAIQPHGFILVLDRADFTIRRAGGDVEGLAGVRDWHGAPVADVLGAAVADSLRELAASGLSGHVARWRSLSRLHYDVTTHAVGELQIVEVEQSSQEAFLGVDILGQLDRAGAAFERAAGVKSLCEQAAREFRRLTGFDRVMIYRFLEDESGVVLAEDGSPELPSYMNHHFPGADIPRQARALYVRNLVRVIPDVRYTPQPLRPAGDEALDMSDCALRSVSPIHLQYLRNMDVGASASVSIVKDGELWGLVACHSARPQLMTHEVRIAAASLARNLSRQIKSREEAEIYRERLRLRGLEDELVARLPFSEPLHRPLGRHLSRMAQLLDADGAVVLRGDKIARYGSCPPDDALPGLARWAAERGRVEPVATDRLPEVFPAASKWQASASGLLAFTVTTDEPFVLMWFRAEEVETVRWAGNPHDAVKHGPSGELTPRASFDAWAETVRGRARRWTAAQVESATRLRQSIFDLRAARQLRRLNDTLRETVADKDTLLKQQDFLLREVNHRIQNSLQLVSSFLALQVREHREEAAVAAALEEARRRIKAVGLVHNRLYRADQFETLDLSRYLRELGDELVQSMGDDWKRQVQMSLAPVSLQTTRAVSLGLVLTELIINVQKYAYGGGPGPVSIVLEEDRDRLRLIVADQGGGRTENAAPGGGFGSRMIESLVKQLEGRIEHLPNEPGLRVVITAPVQPASSS